MNASRSCEGQANKRTSNVEWEEMRDRNSGKPEIELRGAAETRFDIRRWAFHVGRPSALGL
jgi:hypothetical protein